MPPAGVSQPQATLRDPSEGLVRRVRRKKRPDYVPDQKTGKMRPPASAFEPRLPETRPNAKRFDRYLSINVLSSLASAGLAASWRGNDREYYSAQLTVSACQGLGFHATWEPIAGTGNPDTDNPHHGGVHGVVELFRRDRDAYDRAITELAKAAEVLPECLEAGPAE